MIAYTEERCEFGDAYEVPCPDLYNDWRNWSYVNGRKNVGTTQSFPLLRLAAYVCEPFRYEGRKPLRTLENYRSQKSEDHLGPLRASFAGVRR